MLTGVKFLPVHRNKNIDAIIPGDFATGPLLVKIQKENESLEEALLGLTAAAKKKKSNKSILIKTHDDLFPTLVPMDARVTVIESPSYLIDVIREQIAQPDEASG